MRSGKRCKLLQKSLERSQSETKRETPTTLVHLNTTHSITKISILQWFQKHVIDMGLYGAFRQRVKSRHLAESNPKTPTDAGQMLADDFC